MAQSPSRPKRLASVIEALKKHGIKDEELALIQTMLDPLIVQKGEMHLHIDGRNETHTTNPIETHIHVDVHELE